MFVAYYRVSTLRQGQSGLGLDAQKAAVCQYADKIIHSFTEIESGKNNERPQLAAAIAMCKSTGASLLIAKIDRLSRQAAFLLTLRDSGVQILAADMPHAGTLEFGIRAVVAQHEREEISKRTKAALAAAKARGTVLGCPTPEVGSKLGVEAIKAKANAFAFRVAPALQSILAQVGSNLRDVAAELQLRGIKTARGNETWHPAQVAQLIRRVNYAVV